MGNCLFLSARGLENRPPRKKKFAHPRGYALGGGMVRGQIESCINISLSCFSPSPLPLPCLRLPRRLVAYFLFSSVSLGYIHSYGYIRLHSLINIQVHFLHLIAITSF